MDVEMEQIEGTRAQELGFDPTRLGRLVEAISTDTCRGLYDGAAVVVGRGGEVVLQKAVGSADRATGRPARLDDVYCVMSITKSLTTAMVLNRIERGELSLTTRIAEILPAYGVKGKENVTVAHLLTHTGGASAALPEFLPLEQAGNLEAYVAAACRERLQSPPGGIVNYSCITGHGVLGEVVRLLDSAGRPFRQIMREELFEPLGMKDTSINRRADLAPRIVPVVVRDQTPGLFEPLMLEALNSLYTEDSEMPGAVSLSTAGDIFRFAEMLRRGGELDGARILSPAMVRLATTIHTGSKPNILFDYVRQMRGWEEFPANLGLTFFIRGEGLFPTYLGIGNSPGAFAGLGAGSTMFWIDPARDLTFVCLTAGLLEEGASLLRFQRLSDLLIAAVTD